MYRMVFDTETASLNKPFCYDVGYIIFDDVTNETVVDKHFIVEQIWHNIELFATAYYAEKRQKYITLLRSRKAIMTKWGYITQEMIRDIKRFDIKDAYAYNSDFDEKVFNFNCDWFKTQNPFDNVAIHDIWGYASEKITCQDDYKLFCENNEKFTESGNYSGNAETVYQYLTKKTDFIEEHMGLYDAQIEKEILTNCINLGAEYDTDYKVNKILNRIIKHPYKIIVNNECIYEGEYVKKYVRNDNYKFTED